MRSIVTKVVINAFAIWIATLVIPAVIINTFIKPIVKLFTLPLYLLTLGLISFVVNALMLKIVDWLSSKIGITFETGPFFWSTLGAALVITFVSMILNVAIPDGD